MHSHPVRLQTVATSRLGSLLGPRPSNLSVPQHLGGYETQQWLGETP